MENEIVNRVAQSPLITINLEDYYVEGERVSLDIAVNLFEGLILREKDFREFLKVHDWSNYKDKHVAISCSTDAIIPTWAYMLLAVKLEPYAKTLVYGDLSKLEEELFKSSIKEIKPNAYKDKKIVIKGCSKVKVPDAIYVEVTSMLRPFVSSIMYGEPCSTVPIYKAPKQSK